MAVNRNIGNGKPGPAEIKQLEQTLKPYGLAKLGRDSLPDSARIDQLSPKADEPVSLFSDAPAPLARMPRFEGDDDRVKLSLEKRLRGGSS